MKIGLYSKNLLFAINFSAQKIRGFRRVLENVVVMIVQDEKSRGKQDFSNKFCIFATDCFGFKFIEIRYNNIIQYEKNYRTKSQNSP